VTEASRMTIFAQFGVQLWTPPLSSGVLPGVLREEMISDGRVLERVMPCEVLSKADAIYLGNSARGLLLAQLGVETTR
jgi:para-aminobenzoate synthetase/4-amino-4-deoxychorismate lyase